MKNHLPNYDQERVYPSDIRKVFQWYNLLQKADLLKPAESEETENAEVVVTETKPKKEETKKKTAVASSTPAKAAKPASVKKAAPVKTGSSRGK